ECATQAPTYSLPITVRPDNDNFADRVTIAPTNYSLSVTGFLNDATYEPGERTHGEGGSIWWSWTPTTSGRFTFEQNAGGGVAIYEGSAIRQLTLVTNSASPGRLVLEAQAGITHQIALYGCYSWGKLSMFSSTPPAVVLTRPADGTTFTNVTSVVVDAQASDPDGTIVQVDFFLNGLWVGASTNPPYEIVVQDLSSAQYYYQLSALATDSS